MLNFNFWSHERLNEWRIFCLPTCFAYRAFCRSRASCPACSAGKGHQFPCHSPKAATEAGLAVIRSSPFNHLKPPFGTEQWSLPAKCYTDKNYSSTLILSVLLVGGEMLSFVVSSLHPFCILQWHFSFALSNLSRFGCCFGERILEW